MSTWIELRCEDRGGDNEECHSDSNHGPMAMAEDTRVSVLHVFKLIHKAALEDGWKRYRDGWVCPECKKIRDNKKGEQP